MDVFDLEKQIQRLLDSDISTNQLSRKADISMSTISKIRNGKSKLENTSFLNIKRLAVAADKISDNE